MSEATVSPSIIIPPENPVDDPLINKVQKAEAIGNVVDVEITPVTPKTEKPTSLADLLTGEGLGLTEEEEKTIFLTKRKREPNGLGQDNGESNHSEVPSLLDNFPDLGELLDSLGDGISMYELHHALSELNNIFGTEANLEGIDILSVIDLLQDEEISAQVESYLNSSDQDKQKNDDIISLFKARRAELDAMDKQKRRFEEGKFKTGISDALGEVFQHVQEHGAERASKVTRYHWKDKTSFERNEDTAYIVDAIFDENLDRVEATNKLDELMRQQGETPELMRLKGFLVGNDKFMPESRDKTLSSLMEMGFNDDQNKIIESALDGDPSKYEEAKEILNQRGDSEQKKLLMESIANREQTQTEVLKSQLDLMKEKFQDLIEKGKISPEQAEQFKASLEKGLKLIASLKRFAPEAKMVGKVALITVAVAVVASVAVGFMALQAAANQR